MKYNYIKPQVRVHEVRLQRATLQTGSGKEGDFGFGSGGDDGSQLSREDFGWGDDESGWGDGWKK